MVRFFRRDSEFLVSLSESEFAGSGLDESKEYDLIRAKKGVWVLAEREEAIVKKTGSEGKEAEEKVMAKLASKSLSERVEGKFEKLLSKPELEAFKRMLGEGSVIAFKLSPKYKKAVYKIQAEKKHSESMDAGEKVIEDYSLEKDGFLVVKNEERVKKICSQYSERIGDGGLKGLKCFDGFFYIVENDLYEKYRKRAVGLIEGSRSLPLEKIAESLDVSKTLAKIVCEFLKDEGEIIEKRKETYEYIK